MLAANFRDGVAPREEQKKILSEMESLLRSGYKRIIVSAPTGIGKSYIAKAVADSLGTSFIVTSTKQLQDQYLRDFPELRRIKGMSNFECYQLMDKSGVTLRSRAKAKGLTCDKGQCTTKSGSKVVATCEYKTAGERGRQCVYYKQKEEGLRFHQTVLNYAMYFQLKRFQPELDGVGRDVMVFDEAHSIENEVVRFIGYDIRGSYLAETGLDQRDFDLESTGGMISLLDALRESYGELIRRESSDPRTAGDIIRLKRISRRFEGVVSIRRDLNANQDNFIVQDPEFDRQGQLAKVSVVPLDVSKYVPDLFDSDIQVFMSATIDRDNFARIMGIPECGYIDVPISPFPVSSRRVNFLDVARLSSKSPESDELRVAAMIDSMMSTHQNSRGLILTSSRARCHRLRDRLSPGQAGRIEIAHSVNEDQTTIEEVLSVHADTPNGVLLSSSLWQGIDLKGDLSRFQIIEKCPYPSLGDSRVAAKNDADRRWYVYQTIVKLLQGLGRSVRDHDDHAVTYVMDGSVRDLLERNRRMVPAAFHDVLYAERPR